MSADVTPTELEAAIKLIRDGRAPIRMTTAAEVLAAAKLQVITLAEAHALLGLTPEPTVEPVAPKQSWWQKLGAY